MAEKKKNESMPKDWSVIKGVRQEKTYKDNVIRRDRASRKWIEENCETASWRKFVYPGQLISFNYFTPKTAEELEYYDAMPVTLFFGVFKTKEGEPRVIGWNAHYYPPRIRWQIFERVYEIFKPYYKDDWGEPLSREISYFNYHMIMEQLRKAKLEFGVREYIPGLMAAIRPIPINAWPKALLTEGRFRKETRAQILAYWKARAEGVEKSLQSKPASKSNKNQS